MAKITRYGGNLQSFAEGAVGTERTIFGDVAQSDDLTLNITANFLRGWGIVGVNETPSKQDFNAGFFVLSRLIAYLHQVGIPEWHIAQEYNTGSFTSHGGIIYVSDGDANIGNQPGVDAGWTNPLDAYAALAGATFTGPVNTARGTVAMHATTMDIWAQPNVIDGTGSPVTITAIANAPQAGAMRVLYPITGTVITHGATFSVEGSLSYTTEAGDALLIEAVTTSTYNVRILKKALRAPIGGATFSITAGALTVHSTFGGCAMSKSAVGDYFAQLPAYPTNYAVVINQVPSASTVGIGAYYLQSLNRAFFIENGVNADVAGATDRSSILFFEV